MHRFTSKLALAMLLGGMLLQGVTPLANPEVRRIGEKLRCMCGACSYTVTSCNMMACHGATEGRGMLLELVEGGKSEQEILDAFVGKYGIIVLTKPPAEGFTLLGWWMPAIGLVAGSLFLYWAIQRLRTRPVAAVSSAAAGAAPHDRYAQSSADELAKIEASLDE